MKCIKCGEEIMDGARFCPYCGEKIAGEKPEEVMPAEVRPVEAVPTEVRPVEAVPVEVRPVEAVPAEVKPVEAAPVVEMPVGRGAAGDAPIYTADVKNMLKSGRLAVYRDRVEFTSGGAQKTVFDYAALMAVKKGLDRINFITTDGLTVSCPAGRKSIHEAFVYIEQAFRPYLAERERTLLSEGIYYSFVSSLGLNGGVLDILADRAEFRSKSGGNETVWYRDVKSVSLNIVALQFLLIDGTSRSFSVDRELRDDVFSFVEKATAPYIEERKENLLSRGIYYSFPITPGPGGGTVDILADRVEFKFGSGQRETVFYRDVWEARLSMGGFEISLTNGTTRTFAVDKDVREEVLTFVDNAVKPYVKERIAGFGISFGIDERIEINETKGVFHIVRQGGRMFTKEYFLSDLVKCEKIEYSEAGGMLGGVLSGGRSLISGAMGIAAPKEIPEVDKKIDHVGVMLTIRTEQGEWSEGVRFGDFSPGISRMNAKYGRYAEEVSKFTDYLREKCPACELILPEPPANEQVLPELPGNGRTAQIFPERGSGFAAPAAAETAALTASETAAQKDRLGIKKYIEGVSRFISSCETPIMIAIQGSWNNSVMQMLSDELGQHYKGNLIWYNTLQFTQADFGDGFPGLVGNRLVSQLNGSETGGNERAVKAAKGIINIVSGFISQGGTDGQNLTEALFKDSAGASAEKIGRVFSGLIMGRTGGGNGKVVILVDDLDRLTPAQAVELLESLKNFYSCQGCVFVIAADYDFIIRGARDRYHQDFDESRGKSFFDRMFQVSFRVPVSGCNIGNYVKEKLEEMEICGGDEAELETYSELVRYSVGNEPDSLKRLFNSFLLLKKMADEDMFENKNRRLMLFALLCMQTKFREIYDFIVQIKDKVTPAFLSGLCSDQSEVLQHAELSDREKSEFYEFARVFYSVIDTDSERGISEEECTAFTRAFAEVIEFSSITSK